MQNDINIKFKEIQKVLSEEWDPIPGSPKDEYDSYIHRIISMFSEGELDVPGLTDYLNSLFDTEAPENIEEISEKVIAILED